MEIIYYSSSTKQNGDRVPLHFISFFPILQGVPRKCPPPPAAEHICKRYFARGRDQPPPAAEHICKRYFVRGRDQPPPAAERTCRRLFCKGTRPDASGGGTYL